MQTQLLRRLLPALLMLMMFISASTLAHAVQVTSTWTGAGDGTNYTDAANWSPAAVPRNGVPAGTTYKVVIDGNGAKTANVQLTSTSVTIDALVVDQGDSLAINNSLLEVVNSGAGTGTIANGGTISLNFAGGFFGGVTTLRVNGDVTLSGGGTINLADRYVDSSIPLNVISGAAATDRLINSDNTIRGAGGIGAGQMLLTNRGNIVANGTNPMLVQLSAGSNINTGTMRGDGGTLVLFGSSFNNSGGTIEARNGSRAELISTTIIGGTLNTVGSGVVTTTGFRTMTGAILNNVTNTGNIVLSGSSALSLFNTLTNRGTIALNGSGDGKAIIFVNENVTLNGGGSITLSDTLTNGSEFANNINGEGTLTNVDNTISGAALVSGPTIINQGTIVPVGQNALTLLNSITNRGTIRVDAGNKMTLSFARTLTQAAGLLLVNGTFNSSSLNGSGTIAVTGGTLAGTGTIAANVTNSGGTVSPGNFTASDVSSVGTLTINGNYTQTAAGKLFIQINGPTAGSDFDRLVVGPAFFDGALNVKLGGSYAPARDTGFTVVTYSSRTGSMTLKVLDQDNRGGFTQQYNPDSLTLIAQGIPTIGVNIQPTQVFTNTVLTATVITAPETPINSVTYDFQVNGVSKQNSSSNTFDLGVAGQGDKNDVITVIAQTDDDRRNRNSVTVQNTKPVAQTPPPTNARGGQLVSIPLSATDLDNDELTFRIVTGARAGVANIRRLDDGSSVLDYTARPFFNGSENITFIANDGDGDSGFATLTINVTSPAPNRKPSVDGQSVRVEAGVPIDIPIFASDPDGDAVTVKSVGGPSVGSGEFLTVDGQLVFRYTSRVRTIGNDIIFIVAQDGKPGGDSPIARIDIDIFYTPPVVNQRPVASDSSASADSGTQIELPVNITDDGPLIKLFLKSVGGPRNGTGFFRYTPQGFVFVYTARRGFSGTDTVQFYGNDGELDSNFATLTINVSDATPRANSTSVTVNAEQSIDIPITANSPVGSALTYRVVNNPRSGVGQFVTLGGRTVYRYRSVARFNGTDTVNFLVTDSRGRQSAVATIAIRVNYTAPVVNRAPVAQSATVNVPRGQLGVQLDLPINATDPDGDAITYRIVNNPTKGTGQLIVSGGRAFYRYRASGAFNASDRLTFIATDSKGAQSNVATVSINASGSSALRAAPGADDKGGSGGNS